MAKVRSSPDGTASGISSVPKNDLEDEEGEEDELVIKMQFL